MIEIILLYISIVLMILGTILFLFMCLISSRKKQKLVPYKNNKKYAVLIPARNEANVIETLLCSIENQTQRVDSKDVYVIVERKDDPTVNITLKHNMNIIIRENIEGRRRKGYALADAVEKIKEKYAAYFIFDADNILDKSFIKEMSKTIDAGYDIGIGYRNCKNGTSSVVASCSALTFSMMNTLLNRNKVKRQHNVIVSGTGYYIKGELIEKWGTFPFHSLTEDYELSLDATLNGYLTHYNENAIFYDEQPEDYKVSIIQRTRWVKGYFEARKKYIPLIKKSLTFKDPNYDSKIKEIGGVIPFILLILGFIIYFISKSIKWIFSLSIYQLLINILVGILFVYSLLMLFTLYLLIIERNKLKISRKNKVLSIFFNPIFLASYVHCLVISIFKKDLSWQVIKHGERLER